MFYECRNTSKHELGKRANTSNWMCIFSVGEAQNILTVGEDFMDMYEKELAAI